MNMNDSNGSECGPGLYGGRGAMSILRNGCRNKNAACRRYLLAFPLTVVAAGAQGTPQAQVQTGFAPDQLVIPAALGAVFGIQQVTVGNVPQTVGPLGGEVAAEVFGPASFRVGADWTPCDSGTTITLTVRNRDAVNAQTFEGLLLGDAIY